MGFPGGSDDKASACNAETWVQSLGQEYTLEKEMATTSVFLPGKFLGLRSLVGCNPRGHKESDTNEWLHFLSFQYLCVCVCACVCVCVCVCVRQSTHTHACPRPTLCHHMNCSPPGSFVPGILWARILEQVAISLTPGDLLNPGIETVSLKLSALVGRFFTTETPGSPYA